VKPVEIRSRLCGVLTDGEVETLHVKTLRLLQNVGIVIEHAGALNLLKRAGAKVDQDIQRAWIPAGLVEDTMREVPSACLLAGQEPARDMRLEVNGETYTRTIGGPENIYDCDLRMRRSVSREDLVQWTRLAQRLGHIHLVNAIFPSDTSLETRDVTAVATMLANTTKPLIIQAYSNRSLEWIVELAATSVGGLDNLHRRPCLAVYTSSFSPLKYCRDEIDVLITAGKHNLPVFLNSSPLSGATGPVTLSGTLLLMNVEMLAGVVVAQLANRGAPMVYTPKPYFFDMRTGIAAIGYAEMGLLQAAIVQLGKHYGWPTEALGVVTDSNIPDQQAGIEKVQGAALSFLGGASVVGGAGSLGTAGTASLEQMVIDDDIYGYFYRILRGVDFGEDALAEQLIAERGPGKEYLTSDHTLRFFRREFFFAASADRRRHESWEKDGARDTLARAHNLVLRILAQELPEPERVPPMGKLEEICSLAQRDLSKGNEEIQA
jgi:trimethylamine--corrinoid protein Co-methyltransferase